MCMCVLGIGEKTHGSVVNFYLIILVITNIIISLVDILKIVFYVNLKNLYEIELTKDVILHLGID